MYICIYKHINFFRVCEKDCSGYTSQALLETVKSDPLPDKFKVTRLPITGIRPDK